MFQSLKRLLPLAFQPQRWYSQQPPKPTASKTASSPPKRRTKKIEDRDGKIGDIYKKDQTDE